MALAFEWVSKITTVVLEMILPAVAGWWLDRKFGSGKLLTISGLVFGFVAGIAHLLVMTRRKPVEVDGSDTHDSEKKSERK